MSKFDFRILLETVEGQKTSYTSQSFVDTSEELVLSASQVFHRITGSVSCSYQNQLFFSASSPDYIHPTDINSSSFFKDNTLLSASLLGDLSTGSVVLTAADIEYDRLLRYKFFGEKVCNVLGLPHAQWVYVDQFSLQPDTDNNFFQGNINAENLFIGDSLTFENDATVNSDVPFLIDTGSDRHIKFIDERGVGSRALIIGYDKDADIYEISGSANENFHIGGLDKIVFSDGTSQTTAGGGSGTITALNNQAANRLVTIGATTTELDGEANLTFDGSELVVIGDLSASGNMFANRYYGDEAYNNFLTFNQSSSLFKIQNLTYVKFDGSSAQREVTINEGTNDIDFVVKGNSGVGNGNPLFHTDSATHKIGMHGVGGPTAGLHIADDLFVSGSNGHITASGDISASGDLFATDIHLKQTNSPEVKLTDTTNDYFSKLVQFNTITEINFDGNADQDFRFDSNADANHMYLDGGTGFTGIGTSTIPSKLTVDGDLKTNSHITASGNISASGYISASGIRSNDQVNINSSFAQLRLSDDNFSDFLAIGQEGTVGYIKTSDSDNNLKFRRGSDNTDLVEIFFGDERIHISGSG